MLHGVLGSDALCVVILQHLAEQVKGFSRYQVTVFICHKGSPRLAFCAGFFLENVHESVFYMVFASKLFHVGVEVVIAKDPYQFPKFIFFFITIK